MKVKMQIMQGKKQKINMFLNENRKQVKLLQTDADICYEFAY